MQLPATLGLLALLGVGMGLFIPPNNAAVMGSAEPIEQIEQQTTRLDHCCYNRIWSKMQDLGDLARGGEP